MPLPKRRTSGSKRGKRRSHLHLRELNVAYCKKCGEPVLPHHVCASCGHYQGRTAVEVEEE